MLLWRSEWAFQVSGSDSNGRSHALQFTQISLLQQLARSFNESYHESDFIETALFKRLYMMRREYVRLCSKRNACRLPTELEVEIAYSRGRLEQFLSVNGQTVQKTAQIAIRLHMSVIEALGTIMKANRADPVVRRKRLSS